MVLSGIALPLLFIVASAESLVHLQRDDDGRERDAGRVKPGSAVRRGGRRPRRHGKALLSLLKTCRESD